MATVSRYKFDTDGITVDAIGSNTLSLLGTPSLDTTNKQVGDAAASFDGSSEALYRYDVDLSSDFPFKSGTSNNLLSVIGFLHPTSVSGTRGIVVKDSFNNTSFRLLHSSGQFFAYAGYNGGIAAEMLDFGSGLTMSANKWYHFGFTLDGPNKAFRVRLYNITDDVLVGDVTLYATNAVSIDAGYFQIGSLTTGSRFQGQIDDLLVYDEVLDTAAIDDLRVNGWSPQVDYTFDAEDELSASGSISMSLLALNYFAEGLISGIGGVDASFYKQESVLPTIPQQKTWAPGPWPFQEQQNKYGYLNNPNWNDESTDTHRPCGHWHKDIQSLLFFGTFDQQNLTYSNGWYYIYALGQDISYRGHFYEHALVVGRFQERGQFEFLDFNIQDYIYSTLQPIKARYNRVLFGYFDFTPELIRISKLNAVSFKRAAITPPENYVWTASGNAYHTLLFETLDNYVLTVIALYIEGEYEFVYLQSSDYGTTWERIDTGIIDTAKPSYTITPNGDKFIWLDAGIGGSAVTDLYHGTDIKNLTKVTWDADSSATIYGACSNSEYVFLLYVDGGNLLIDRFEHDATFVDTTDTGIAGALSQIACSETGIVVYSSEDVALYRAPISTMVFVLANNLYSPTFQANVMKLEYVEGKFIFVACDFRPAPYTHLGWAESNDDGVYWIYKKTPINAYGSTYGIDYVRTINKDCGERPWPFEEVEKENNSGNGGFWKKT